MQAADSEWVYVGINVRKGTSAAIAAHSHRTGHQQYSFRYGLYKTFKMTVH
jgi:hypothetical protein